MAGPLLSSVFRACANCCVWFQITSHPYLCDACKPVPQPGDPVPGPCPRCEAVGKIRLVKRDGEVGLDKFCRMCGWRQRL